MRTAQEILHSRFKGTRGSEYMAKERHLDPDLAYKLGAGFGTDSLIHGLLDAGFTLDDLIYYGFLLVYSQVDISKGIVPLLKKRGLSLKKIRRDTGRKTEDRETVWGYPISILRRRVTFPRASNGIINNFYGRATWNASKQSRHRKLPTKYTEVLQGGFNMDVLYSNSPEVSLVEGVMDALSQIELAARGVENTSKATLAVVGTDNAVVLEEIARSKKNIAIALDNDEGGWLKTYGWTDEHGSYSSGLIEKLIQKGCGTVRDQTAEFALAYPDFKEGMDWNEYFEIYIKKAAAA
jgi:hypothetical protein